MTDTPTPEQIEAAERIWISEIPWDLGRRGGLEALGFAWNQKHGNRPTEYVHIGAYNALAARVAELEEVEAIAERDGYEKAVQDIDRLTGGNGEFCAVLGYDPDGRHCPDVPSMKERIKHRFEGLKAQPAHAVTVKPLEWTGIGNEISATAYGIERAYLISGEPGNWQLRFVGNRQEEFLDGFERQAAAMRAAQKLHDAKALPTVTARPESEVWNEAIEAAAEAIAAIRNDAPTSPAMQHGDRCADAIRALKKGGA